MKQVTSLSALDPGRPDDLLVTCCSFEDRCLGLMRVAGADYRAAQSLLLVFRSAKPHPAIDRQRRNNLRALEGFMLQRSQYAKTATVGRYNPFELELLFEEAEIERRIRGGTVSIDISCFTRIQLLFALRLILSAVPREIRLLYTTPSYYASLDRKPLAFGFDGMLFLPYVAGGARADLLGAENFLIAGLSHEGARCLVAWHSLEPARTSLFLPDNPRSPDVTSVTERQNEQLLQRNRAGDTRVSVTRVNPLRMKEMINGVSATLDDLHLRDDTATISMVPSGPKPLVAAMAISAHRMQIPVCVAYPLVSGYDPAYSSGIGGVYEYRFRPLPDHKRSRSAPSATEALAT